MRRIGVLMVSGAYFPELSGGGLQCCALVRALRTRVRFVVLTTTSDPSLPLLDEVEGVTVHRVPVDPRRAISKLMAAIRMVWLFLRISHSLQVVHLHGFSQKSLLLILLARLSGKRLIQTMHTAGHDDPQAVRARGFVPFHLYAAVDRFVSVSPHFATLYRESTLPHARLREIPNGIDIGRFQPPGPGERERVRRELGLPEDLFLILFVGFFSREKRPHLLFDAWVRVRAHCPASGLLFVGATDSPYYEVDRSLVKHIRSEATALGAEKTVFFIERTHEIERCYRAANLFVMPSTREGLPIALLEAMASGLPCLATRLPGVTDTIIDHGQNGLLFPPDDLGVLAGHLTALLADDGRAHALGQKARETVTARYTMEQVASQYLEEYEKVVEAPRL